MFIAISSEKLLFFRNGNQILFLLCIYPEAA